MLVEVPGQLDRALGHVGLVAAVVVGEPGQDSWDRGMLGRLA
jgi:hypothetical protein